MLKRPTAESDDAKTSSRSFWSGTITFGLVSVPVDFYAANRASAGRLFLVTDGGDRVGRRYVCPAHGEAISNDEIVRGYEVEPGEFVVLSDEELEAAQPERTRDIELVSFVRAEDVPVLAFRRSYFLAPAGKSTKAYALLAETMQKSARAGIGTFVMRGKAYVVAIFAEGGVLRAETLRFKSELRSPEDLGLDAHGRAKRPLVAQMVKAIGALSHDEVDVAELVDAHAASLEKLARKKLANDEDVIRPKDDPALAEREARATAIDLFELLKERLGQSGAASRNGGDDARSGSERPKDSDRPRKRQGDDGEPPLRERAKSDLYQQAKDLGIEGRSHMSKQDLLAAIQAALG